MLHMLNAPVDSGSATVRVIVDSRLQSNDCSHCQP
jgi:hypothetical protein